jgi:hypothetical protein
MGKLSEAIAIAVFSIGTSVALSVEAAPLLPLPAQNQSAVEHVGCTSPGPRCPLGRTWVCGPCEIIEGMSVHGTYWTSSTGAF